MEKLADIGVFGGSGFYSFLEDIKEVQIDTPYGKPSDSLFIGKIGQHRVAFMPRHARNHSILPHQINYRANVWAMKEAGCKRVISPCAAGSLQKHGAPGHFVICDQFVDWTDGRKSTFFEGPTCYHPSPAETYCPELRSLAIKTAKELGITVITPWTVLIAALFGSIGLSMIFPKKKKISYKKSNWSIQEGETIKVENEGNIKISSSFSGGTKFIKSDKFESAEITCKFSGLQVYFDNAVMAKDTAFLKLDISFSGVELYVPRSWHIENRTNVFLGGIEDEKYGNVVYTNTLIITGDVSLAGVEIHYI